MTKDEIKARLLDFFVYIEGEPDPPSPFAILDALKEFRSEYIDSLFVPSIINTQKKENEKKKRN